MRHAACELGLVVDVLGAAQPGGPGGEQAHDDREREDDREAVLERVEMRRGRSCGRSAGRCCAARERGEDFGAEQRAERIEAEERREQVADRRQVGEAGRGGVRGRRSRSGRRASRAGRWLVSPMIISEKKMAIEIGMPAFWKVPRMPEATPRSRAGTLFMIEVVFGAANRPKAIPLAKITSANSGVGEVDRQQPSARRRWRRRAACRRSRTGAPRTCR